jgi:hypothetical protein
MTATVLVVDDDKAIREGLSRAISASGAKPNSPRRRA